VVGLIIRHSGPFFTGRPVERGSAEAAGTSGGRPESLKGGLGTDASVRRSCRGSCRATGRLPRKNGGRGEHDHQHRDNELPSAGEGTGSLAPTAPASGWPVQSQQPPGKSPAESPTPSASSIRGSHSLGSTNPGQPGTLRTCCRMARLPRASVTVPRCPGRGTSRERSAP